MHILSHSWASQLRKALIITMLNYYHDNTDSLVCFFFSSLFWNDRDKWLFSVTQIFNQSKCRPFDYFWSHSYPSNLGKHNPSTFTDGEGKTFPILSEHLKVAIVNITWCMPLSDSISSLLLQLIQLFQLNRTSNP